MQTPASLSPLAKGGRKRRFWSSLPKVLIIQETMTAPLMMPPRLIQPRDSSSTMAA